MKLLKSQGIALIMVYIFSIAVWTFAINISITNSNENGRVLLEMFETTKILAVWALVAMVTILMLATTYCYIKEILSAWKNQNN